ncbi:DNA lyase, partial [bacterium]
GENLAILDRHILKNLLKLGVISSIPPSLSRRQYLEIEKKFIEYAKKTGIPPAHLDFVLWYRETGKVFK